MADSLPLELSKLLAASPGSDAEAAWETFVFAYSPLLLHAARSEFAEYDEAMDGYTYVLEQLREEGFRRLKRYAAQPSAKFTTWLVLVARRMCIDRRRERYGRLVKPESNNGTASDERAARRRLVDLAAAELDLTSLEDTTTDNPEGQLRSRELRDAVAEAIGSLEPGDQLLLTLRFNDGLSAREIAALQGFSSYVLVYRRIAHVLRILRRHLESVGVDTPAP